ncbi:hypothetical protein ACRALDRAFT_2056244 [Sodiomyces alcalophilus JCM 7366]|uniref:uncharacterized protein n=1 Tax=Sodiomyces alcalophilus JCM 7366 TaxID=591952 RepID=UPI0039B3D913
MTTRHIFFHQSFSPGRQLDGRDSSCVRMTSPSPTPRRWTALRRFSLPPLRLPRAPSSRRQAPPGKPHRPGSQTSVGSGVDVEKDVVVVVSTVLQRTVVAHAAW